MIRTLSDIDTMFTYVPPNEETTPKYKRIRLAESSVYWVLADIDSILMPSPGRPTSTRDESFANITDACRTLAIAILEECPDCADRTAAFRCLRLARNAMNEFTQLAFIALEGHAPEPSNELLTIARMELQKARWQACSAIALGGKF
jgi:uncharacterized protein (DUF849 family)